MLCPAVFLGGEGEATDGMSFRPSARGLLTTPSRARLKTKKPPRSPGFPGHREGLLLRGSGRSRTDDGGFAIRCLSHLATEPYVETLRTLRKTGRSGQARYIGLTLPLLSIIAFSTVMRMDRP